MFWKGLRLIILIGLLILNLRLYFPRPAAAQAVPREAYAELRYLKHALENGAGEEMQRLFPEGDFFTHVLYGLSWVNVGLQLPEGDVNRAMALSEARWAWAELGEQSAIAPFYSGQSLQPEFGIFYRGWRNYLLTGIMLLQDPAELDPAELAIYRSECAAIGDALTQNSIPFLQAYLSAAWPVDMLPALVSLRGCAELVDDRYHDIIEIWLVESEAYHDPNTGLLPHFVDYRTGEMRVGARATSQVLILKFLFDLDPERGAVVYRRFREQYVVPKRGIIGVLEYPKEVEGRGDVDSGPLIEGVSLSATAVMLGTARIYGDKNVQDGIWHAGEMLGMPFRWRGMKRYGFGLFPVGDGFAVWSKSTVPWFESMSETEYPPILPWWWRLRLHALSLLALLPFWFGPLLVDQTRNRFLR